MKLPNDMPDGAPVVILLPRPGIPGIDASKLRWRVWQLLNEANSCYANLEFDGCLSSLQSALEAWLREQFEAKGLNPSKIFQRAIEVGKQKGLLDEEESSFFDELREFRNKLVHTGEGPWMYPTSVNEMTNPPKPVDKSLLQKQGSKDLLTLVNSSEMSWRFLVRSNAMMRKRYPANAAYFYWVAPAVQHGDTKVGSEMRG